ncbi:hypothetical protein EAJ17_00780 [Akkermansia sp. aa_0143]|nr:hypothetical protein EAJ17_00780 [Akkermansia sp. aa_0143]
MDVNFLLRSCGRIFPAIETGSLHSLHYGIEAFSSRSPHRFCQPVTGCGMPSFLSNLICTEKKFC